ncbi:MAG: hypothetical protein NVSMB18_04290 [Acetobacteraceae bacterium]
MTGAGVDLLVTRRDGVHVLTLNRPDRVNALTAPLISAMTALDDAERDADCRAVLLHGAGRGFCSGQDLTEVQHGATPDFQEGVRAFLEKRPARFTGQAR